MACYNGPEADGRKAMAPLLDALPQPWFNWMSVMPYPAVQSMFDGLFSLYGPRKDKDDQSSWPGSAAGAGRRTRRDLPGPAPARTYARAAPRRMWSSCST